MKAFRDPISWLSISKHLSHLIFGLAVAGVALPLAAQEKRASPHQKISAGINGATITLVYGRPSTKDPKTGEARKVWGELVPYDKVWRTGDNEATLLITDKLLLIGKTTIPAGTNSLYMLLAKDGTAKLIVNKQVGQWGTKYDPSQDLARADMKGEPLDKTVEQFTMAVVMNPFGGGTLKIMWENTQFSLPFYVRQ